MTRTQPNSRLRLATLWVLLVCCQGDSAYASGSLARGPGDRRVEVPLSTAWIPIGERRQLKTLDVGLTDSNGRASQLGDLVDKPVLITFFYTRCENSRKCSAAVGRLAALQRRLAEVGMDRRVRLLAITYEPQFDTSERIGRYATARGLELGEDALTVRLDSVRHQQVVDELQAPVNYNAEWVNTHGVELSLLDAKGRLVRKYTTILWDNDQVTDDLKRILAERQQ